MKSNPRWCDVISWFLRHIGNIYYLINGRLDSLEKKNRRRRLMFYFWRESLRWGDVQYKSKIKGCRQELPERDKA